MGSRERRHSSLSAPTARDASAARHPDDGPQTSGCAAVTAAGLAFLLAIGVVVRAIVQVVELLSTRTWSFLASSWQDPSGAERAREGDGLGLIGPSGASVPVSQAYLRVEDLPASATAAVLIEIIIAAVTGVALLILVCLLCRNLIRGAAFIRANTRILSWAGISLFTGHLVSSTAGNAAADRALSMVGAEAWTCLIGCPGGTAPSVDYAPYMLALVFGVLAVVFRVGERLRRDTEGLV